MVDRVHWCAPFQIFLHVCISLYYSLLCVCKSTNSYLVCVYTSIPIYVYVLCLLENHIGVQLSAFSVVALSVVSITTVKGS
jgi:hypothetical protein